MMKNVSWQDHFKNQIADAANSHQTAAEPGSLLLYCLRNHLLISAEYLAWAKEAYQLPILSEKYFTANPPTLDFFNRYQSQYAWSAECLPVAEWDGTLIVACLETPLDYSGRAIFVLTSYENLAQAWSVYSATVDVVAITSNADAATPALNISSVEAPTFETSIGISAGEGTVVKSQPDENELFLADLGEEVAPSAEASAEASESSSPKEIPVDEEEVEGTPEGLFGDVTTTGPSPGLSLNKFIGVKLEPLTPPPAPALDDSATDLHQARQKSQILFATAEPKRQTLMEASIASPSALHEVEVSMEEAAKVSAVMPKASLDVVVSSVEMHPVVSDEVTSPSIKPMVAPPRQEPSMSEVASAMHQEILKKGPRTSRPLAIDTLPGDEDSEPVGSGTQKKALGALVNDDELPKAPVKLTQAPVIGAAAYFLEKIRKNHHDTFDKDVIASFNQCKTFFKKSMLLAIGDKDRVVKPILWDGGDFDVRKPSMIEFSLKIPSIFRIVSTTQKPYHGFVSLNDLNEAFFESWNHGQIPDHVTIVPLMDHDLVVGMLMGFGEKSCYNKNVLQFTENAAKDLSVKILKSVQKAA